MCQTHGVVQQGVEDDQGGARNQMNEDDAQPPIDTEVEVVIMQHERDQSLEAAGECHSLVYDRFDFNRQVLVLEEPRRLREEGCDVDDDYGLDRVRDRADNLGSMGVADADVSLASEGDRQPDGRRVAYGRQVDGEGFPGVAPGVRDVVAVVSGRVEVEETGDGEGAGQGVRDSHCDQQEVRRRAHVALEKDDADEAIGDDDEWDENRRDVSADEDINRTRPQMIDFVLRRSIDHR